MPKVNAEQAGGAPMRERIKQAARALFIQHGLSEVTYGDIAERVGTTRANLHYHFGNKANLVAQVFEETFREVDESLRAIWLSPERTLDQRLAASLEDSRRRFFEFNERSAGRNPWSLTARASLSYDNALLSDEIRRGIGRLMTRFEEYVNHAVRLAIGSGELRADTPVETVVLLIVPLWRFGALVTRFDGLDKLEAHYEAVRTTLRYAYARDTGD